MYGAIVSIWPTKGETEAQGRQIRGKSRIPIQATYHLIPHSSVFLSLLNLLFISSPSYGHLTPNFIHLFAIFFGDSRDGTQNIAHDR